jgi:transitional endoplasmic reticulum ATPase
LKIIYKLSSKSNDNKKSTEITTLKVAEAEQRDVGRKIARVDPEVARRRNITSVDA